MPSKRSLICDEGRRLDSSQRLTALKLEDKGDYVLEVYHQSMQEHCFGAKELLDNKNLKSCRGR